MLLRRFTVVPLMATAAIAASAGCAALAGLDEDYVAGGVDGSGAATTSTTSTSPGGMGGAAAAGAGTGGTATGTTSGGGTNTTSSGGTGGTGAAGGGPADTYPDVVLADGPVAYWRFGEANGPTAVDSSGHAHHATYNGSVEYGVAGAIAGDTDTAIHFTGSGADVSHPMDFDDFEAKEPYTLEAWFKGDEYDGDYRHLYNKDYNAGGNGRHNIGLFVNENEKLGFERFVAGEKHQAAGDLPPIGVWTHIVGTYDGQDLRLYVNGDVVRTAMDDRAQDSKPVPSFIGAKTHTYGALKGTLDEFAIYDYALSAGRVAKHHDAGGGL